MELDNCRCGVVSTFFMGDVGTRTVRSLSLSIGFSRDGDSSLSPPTESPATFFINGEGGGSDIATTFFINSGGGASDIEFDDVLFSVLASCFSSASTIDF